MIHVSQPTAAKAASLNLNSANAAVTFETKLAVRTGVSVHLASGSWGNTVIAFEKSIDGTNFFAFTPAVQLTAAGFVSLDTADCLWARARVSTVAGSSGTGTVNAVNKGDG